MQTVTDAEAGIFIFFICPLKAEEEYNHFLQALPAIAGRKPRDDYEVPQGPML
jgi:hypothetical protein